MINISINNNSDSNNYPRLDLDAGQETIQIKLHLRKMCVFGAGNVFKEEEKLMLWKNISPSSGNNCSFPFWGSCKRKECPSRIEIFNGEFPTPSDYRERCVQSLRLEGETESRWSEVNPVKRESHWENGRSFFSLKSVPDTKHLTGILLSVILCLPWWLRW